MIDAPPFASRMIRRAALQDMRVDSLDLADVLSDQVRRLIGSHSRTRKAIGIFGLIGQHNQVSEFAGSDSPLNVRLRRSRKSRTLLSLILSDIGSLVETLATSIVQIIGNSMLWIWKTVNANSFILAILAFSVLINLVFSSRQVSEWWRERKATTFMSKLGVGSDQLMIKAISVKDIEDAIVPNDWSSSVIAKRNGSMCRNTFDGIMNISDHPDGTLPGSESFPVFQEPEAVHLQARRYHLNRRRHDLMVALRIVNVIEQKILHAEWESWLVAEKARCHHFRTILEKNTTELKEERRNEVTGWYKSYCGSCEKDYRQMLKV